MPILCISSNLRIRRNQISFGIFKSSTAPSTSPFCGSPASMQFQKTQFHLRFMRNSLGVSSKHLLRAYPAIILFHDTTSRSGIFSDTFSPHRQTQCVNILQLMYSNRPHLIEAFYQTDRVQTLYFHILHKRQQGNSPHRHLT